jgi:hypothetical protein
VLGLFIPGRAAAQPQPLTVNYQTNRIGVGTASPAYTLDVNGTVNATSFRGDASQLTNLPAGSQWTTSGTAIGYGAGNVGIGTTTPERALQIERNGQWGGGLSIRNMASNGGAYSLLVGDGSGYEGKFLLYQDGVAFRLAVDANGNVGIGTVWPSSALHVNGTITGSAKNFQIPHPLMPRTHVLIHSAVEGPEVAVYYRGVAELASGEAVVTLPSYFEALVRPEDRTVQLTPVAGWSPLYVVSDIADGQFTVRTTAQGNASQRFYWEVKAVRADLLPLTAEAPRPDTSPASRNTPLGPGLKLTPGHPSVDEKRR